MLSTRTLSRGAFAREFSSTVSSAEYGLVGWSILLDRLLQGETLHTLLLETLIPVDGCSNQDSQDANCAFIAELRETFTVLLEDAKRNNILPWE